jgi:serine/threonine protein kinase
LTHTGDIVGTLRYMAPERFEGASLPRSDVDALGMTLYEMLTLRPAFGDSNRARLVQRILHEDPVPPRKLDPRIPRDLETVVLKAIAHDPARRYATAGDLAEDLRRFLADRPVRARRSRLPEHLWRWCRRNPAVASLTTVIALLLLLVAIGSNLSAWSLRAAEKNAREKLWRSKLNEARATVRSRMSGQRFTSLKRVREAIAIARELGLTEEDRFAVAQRRHRRPGPAGYRGG